jgi:hypothetical protein
MPASCGQCACVIVADSGGRLPPWCPKCGADLKPGTTVARGTQAARNLDDGGRNPEAASVSTVGQSSEDADQLGDRFGLHNLIVGLLLAAVAFVLGFLLEGNASTNRLKISNSLAQFLTILQLVTVGNGLALFASGIGIRQRQTWGYPLAVVSAAVLVLAGAAFFGVFYLLSRIDGLEHSVALFPFIWTNIDFVAGFVDGGGLLYFLHKYQGQLAVRKPLIGER